MLVLDAIVQAIAAIWCWRKPNVIMNDIRLRELAVAGTEGAGRKSPRQPRPDRNLRRSLWNAAAGARLIQADLLDSKSAADVAASLAYALEDLRRLQRSLDRRIRRLTRSVSGAPAAISHPLLARTTLSRRDAKVRKKSLRPED